ncbi:MAG TPA: hypothetical protein PLF13_01950 [candidate division Zixibacteria bacterium]|nr:hypothetical protein [candidate division Zixibacteria bacterium]
MKLFTRMKKRADQPISTRVIAADRASGRSDRRLMTHRKLQAMLDISRDDIRQGNYRTRLYRFLTDHVPVIDSCVWTWSRLAAAPGRFELIDTSGQPVESTTDRSALNELTTRIGLTTAGRRQELRPFLIELFRGLFRDGLFGGFATVRQDGSGLDCFIPVDPVDLACDTDGVVPKLKLENGDRTVSLDRADYYQIILGDGLTTPLGRSILASIPFVTYIEQQLVDDMRRASHNSGFHRLHVKITPPERLSGESDRAYVERINGYFDSTVSMIKSCEVDDNPVTWDNVQIEYIGPENTRAVSNNWFMNHRAMIEEICAGTNLAPFLLGYSYGDTTTWASFKFDLVMRQVTTVQAQAAAFLSWLGDIHLALNGSSYRCRYRFDNGMAWQAADSARVATERIDGLLRLYEAGLIDRSEAQRKATGLI